MATPREREEKVSKKWQDLDVFKKTVEKTSPKGDFVFYDGPPFATGTPHYGHILASTIKDIIPRWKTMEGYRVRRRWGWDCHGLPVENLIEKELNLKSKKDIVSYGIKKFNENARGSVMKYAEEWRKMIPRIGRFVDMDNDYKTMDSKYTESVWWAFKTLYEKNLVYEGFKVMQICPHCETSLSNFEVAQGYRDIADISVYVKFELSDSPGKFLIAWTTTPWTLPGNTALAVSSDSIYLEIQLEGINDIYIFAKERIESLKSLGLVKDYKIIKEYKGSDMVGKLYKPVFDFYKKESEKNKNAWKIYSASFVTMESGTGIVHIAPAFGADDYELLKKYNLPLIQHVSLDGTFKEDFSENIKKGTKVKPKNEVGEKDAHQRADVEVIKYLAHRGLLFAKEKINHSYPHCWRCETPLLNYASSSWFVKVSSIKNDLVKENKKIEWVPEEVGQGRFGNWLKDARDWAISRSRFWGAPIPVWKNEKTGRCVVMSSVDDLKKYSRANNTYFVMRHGEAENNIKNIVSSKSDNPHHLTDNGKKQAKEAGKKIRANFIYTSPFVRTLETAEIVRETIGLGKDKVIIDERLKEIDAGIFNGKNIKDFHAFFHGKNRFNDRPEGGENYNDIRRRTGDFIYDLEKKHKGETILIVTHDSPAWLLFASACGYEEDESEKMRGTGDFFIKNAEIKKLDFIPLPHSADYSLDLHRPYIDDVVLRDFDGSRLVRVPEVFDCWFESGSMPFAESHYPRHKDEFNPSTGIFGSVKNILGIKSKGYPADFIGEGLDQTRGWFYSMLVLGTALFGVSPYKRVIVNGLILAEDGQKMSKSKKNFPDPEILIEKYGADAMRFYMISSPVVRGQDLRFMEKGVDETSKKHIGRLLNVVSFYEMYKDLLPKDLSKSQDKRVSSNLLDAWIMARLRTTVSAVHKGLDSYELDKASRPIEDFIDDLSTWYLRRSRDRFKDSTDDRLDALLTTQKVLTVFARLIAPFMPFTAEEVFEKVSDEIDKSVHLESWPYPEYKNIDKDSSIERDMKVVRDIASLGLEARAKSKINVRQPLSKLTINLDSEISDQMREILKDEINIKNIVINNGKVLSVDLDTNITKELKEEGVVREVMRTIQDFRKKAGLSIKDRVSIILPLDAITKEIVLKNEIEIKRGTGVIGIEYEEGYIQNIKIKN